jgi:hypothetical protein
MASQKQQRKKVRPSIRPLSMEVEEITPTIATQMLKSSKRKNRPNVPAKIAQYTEAMKEKRWNPYNSTAISIDTNGDLVNGHNRLEACILAGVPFRTIVIRGVPPETFETEDTGQFRSPGDFLHIVGEVYPNIMATITRSMMMWERGAWHYATLRGSRSKVMMIRTDQMLEEIARRPNIRKATKYFAERLSKTRARFNVGLVGALWVLGYGHERHADFWDGMIDGINVGPNSPIRLIRDRMEDSKSVGRRMSSTQQNALVTKAWNFYAQKQEPERLMYNKDREREFPQPITRLEPQLVEKVVSEEE